MVIVIFLEKNLYTNIEKEKFFCYEEDVENRASDDVRERLFRALSVLISVDGELNRLCDYKINLRI